MTSTVPLPELAGARNDVRPMTGDEYLDSLRDGREIYIYGERVEDVTTHPGFRNSARSIARLYDALHAPEAEGGSGYRPRPGTVGSPTPFSRPRAPRTT